ncbi:peptide/nickel transport system ATP-binding protein [Austwickia chelonae]|uniref:Putative ABC transporter ATP-binding protein n=1 Tax=Austwickia chelonae NBRC 105200 TaxID=1184607 RepID=K6VKP6_9MICO|nr:ABC transporter ATP-binding protein [Austwickia chelonae]GAB77314.1 putative ABC transporter ATP-binding protein [Austwickia chelonae NBRC 105200]SEW07606.1 peptide/nickel transport system ATP-binding protein [Austwickia chelonae]
MTTMPPRTDGWEPDDDALLQVQGLRIATFRRELVHDIDLTVRRGERVGLIGESGSGKTLTALAVMGLLDENLHATGRIHLAGVQGNLLDLGEKDLSRLRGSRMGMVFQEPMTALNPTMRIGTQVAETMLLHGRTNRAGAHREVIRLLTDVRLPDPEHAARAYPHQLSGGQRQRVVLAMALANSSDLLICDEPTTALDVTVQANVLDLVVRGVSRPGAGLLFISHDLGVIATVCDRVVVMYDGRVVETGNVREVLSSPVHDYTRRLVAASELRDLEERRKTGPAAARPTSTGRDPDRAEGRTPGKGDSLIQVRSVTREYRRPRISLREPPPVVTALRDVDLTVHKGERLGIVGESGCGKSTLLRLIAGIDHPTQGAVLVNGRQVSGVPERGLGFLRASLQMVFQDPMGSLDPRMRVYSSVREPLLATGCEGHRERIWSLLDSVGIAPESATRYPHQFSGGQRQRISIARAIGPEPDILLADEPVSALDVSVRAQVLDILDHLVDDLGLTLVFVSHDLSVVRHVCERVVVMKAGQIVEEGPVGQIYTDPRHPYTRRLVASIPTVERALSGVTAADLAAARAEEHPTENADASTR